MKKVATAVLGASMLLAIALSSAGSRTTRTEAGSSPVPTPTPTVVPGTELRGRVATTKPGYSFIKRENGVTVVNNRTNAYMGAYTCPCGSTDPNRKCDLVFSPTYITCKGGSCSGSSCLLVGSTPTMRQ
jgi:hypothetical protein